MNRQPPTSTLFPYTTLFRSYKELLPMKKEQVNFLNKTVWIPDSKTRNGVAELPLTEVAIQAFRSQMLLAGRSEEHTSELQSHSDLVCRLLLEKKKKKYKTII